MLNTLGATIGDENVRDNTSLKKNIVGLGDHGLRSLK